MKIDGKEHESAKSSERCCCVSISKQLDESNHNAYFKGRKVFAPTTTPRLGIEENSTLARRLCSLKISEILTWKILFAKDYVVELDTFNMPRSEEGGRGSHSC